jgi:hypothetical protein
MALDPQSYSSRSVVDFAESAIRDLVRKSNFPVSRLITIAREEQRAQWTAINEWEAAAVEGDKAKPLIEGRSGPSFSTDEVSERLQCSTQTVRNLKERGELLAYAGLHGNNGLRFPCWQFEAEGRRTRAKPWVPPLVAAYQGNGWGLLDFLTVPRESLQGLSYLASTERGQGAIGAMIEAAARSNAN